MTAAVASKNRRDRGWLSVQAKTEETGGGTIYYIVYIML